YSICPICFWEDDALQLEFATTLGGGANRLTLADAQRAYAERGAKEERVAGHVRPVSTDDRRDPLWRPVDPAVDTFEAWDDPDATRAPGGGETLYYWRPTFWRRAPAT